MIYIILIVLLNLAIGAKGGRREDKVFSLFNIVRFPNSACSGDSYTGYWKQGKKDGYGEYRWADSSNYTGYQSRLFDPYLVHYCA